MFIHSGTLKRAGILAAVVAVGTAAAITYNAFLSSEGGLPEVLSPADNKGRGRRGKAENRYCLLSRRQLFR